MQRARQGFSLIEALVALAIAAMVLTAIFELQQQMARGQRRAADMDRLVALKADGLVETSPTRITATSRGRLLLRIIAACFDRYLHQAQAEPTRFSKAI